MERSGDACRESLCLSIQGTRIFSQFEAVWGKSPNNQKSHLITLSKNFFFMTEVIPVCTEEVFLNSQCLNSLIMEQKGDGCLGASNHNLVIARTVVVTRTKDSPSQGNCLSLSHTHTQTERCFRKTFSVKMGEMTRKLWFKNRERNVNENTYDITP